MSMFYWQWVSGSGLPSFTSTDKSVCATLALPTIGMLPSSRRRPQILQPVEAEKSRPAYHRVDRWRHDERQHQREEQAADYADGQRLQELRAGAEGQREREHAEHRGEGRHQHRAEAAAAGAAKRGGEV